MHSLQHVLPMSCQAFSVGELRPILVSWDNAPLTVLTVAMTLGQHLARSLYGTDQFLMGQSLPLIRQR